MRHSRHRLSRVLRLAVTSRRGGLTVLALAAVTAGIVLLAVAQRAQVSAAAPPADEGSVDVPGAHEQDSPPGAGADASPSAPRTPAPAAKPLPPSRPVHVSIPSIHVSSKMFPIGKNPDGSVAVPQPGPHLDQVAWYRNSPTPGQPGPSVILGHVDTVRGASVFLKLGDVRPGDTIRVEREDGVRVTFTVDAIRDYKKSRFPTRLVYGGDTSRPTLRVITCSDWDPAIDHHTGNLVVFAHLTKANGPGIADGADAGQ